MTVLFNEVARQHAVTTKSLLEQRKRSRILVLTLAYLLVAVAGVGAAALVADNNRADAALIGAAIAMPIFLLALFASRNRIHRLEKSLDQSLDIIAATRAMAIEANASANEQDRLRDIFHELQDARARGLFGKKKTLL